MSIRTWLISLACMAALTSSAAAQCTRHFYNNSNVPWSVTLGAAGLCNNAPSCIVPPRRTATIIYFPLPVSPIVITSPFYAHGFGLTGCKIIHSGNTGAISVNDPADGDVQTCGRGGWTCPPIRRALRKSRKA